MKTFKQYVSEELKPIQGTQYGSNEGGIHTDEHGNQHYVKYYKNPDQAKTEVLTGKIYKHMGIHTLEPEHHIINGKSAVVTKWNPGLDRVKPKEFETVNPHQANQLAKMHYAAALTKNWDIVGLEHDNIMKDRSGNMVSIDHGGSFNFRARGSHKDYGPDITEKESLRNNHEASGHVFSSVYSQHPDAENHAKEAVKNIDDKYVEHLFKTSGLPNHDVLYKSFMARKAALTKG